MELKYTTRGPRLIEVNCRMGGGPVRLTNLLVRTLGYGIHSRRSLAVQSGSDEAAACFANLPTFPPRAQRLPERRGSFIGIFHLNCGTVCTARHALSRLAAVSGASAA